MDWKESVNKERNRQDAKWGEQNHTPAKWLAILVEEVGELAKAMLENNYGGIDDNDVESELVQVAAVAKVAWEDGKRNNWL